MTQLNPRRLERRLRSFLLYLIVVVFLVSILLPIYYIFLTAFSPGDKLFSRPLYYLPRVLNLDRYRELFDQIPVGRYMLNTAFLAILATLLALIISFLAAYAIARIRFPGANLVLVGLLASSMLPFVTTVIPLFKMYRELKLDNTIQGLLLLYTSMLLPITTWVLVSFLRQVPAEIEDAAKVDGAGFGPLLFQIVLPMIRPGLATMFLIDFISAWNEFLTPLIFARGAGSKVLTIALSEALSIGTSSQYYLNYGQMSSVAILATIPVFFVTLVFQRQIVEGITSGVFK